MTSKKKALLGGLAVLCLLLLVGITGCESEDDGVAGDASGANSLKQDASMVPTQPSNELEEEETEGAEGGKAASEDKGSGTNSEDSPDVIAGGEVVKVLTDDDKRAILDEFIDDGLLESPDSFLPEQLDVGITWLALLMPYGTSDEIQQVYENGGDDTREMMAHYAELYGVDLDEVLER